MCYDSTVLRNRVPVKIKRLHPDAKIPQYATSLAAGYDLVAIEDTLIYPGTTELISTGLAFQIPEGYEMQIRPRSGVSLNTWLRVSNSPATIDSDYRGEVKVLIDNMASLSNMRSKQVETVDGDYIIAEEEHEMGTHIIRRGDRICQGVICEAPQALFEEVKELDDTERGTGGFGSTGVNG
jgi:dUTP pyrophosphatase